MKYLVNRETKEHRILTDSNKHMIGMLDIVDADPEGWIKHDGGECPLPDWAKVSVQFNDSTRYYHGKLAGHWNWSDPRLHSYRPVIDDKPMYTKEGDTVTAHDCHSFTIELPQHDLIGRLRAAHKAASELPDIIAELREVLEPIGYDLVARDPFVEPEYQSDTQKLKVPPELQFTASCILCGSTKDDAHSIDCPNNKPEPDMTDWRNWREGDLVEVVADGISGCYPKGALLNVGRDLWGDFGVKATTGNVHSMGMFKSPSFDIRDFRFHSRPTKEQDK